MDGRIGGPPVNGCHAASGARFDVAGASRDRVTIDLRGIGDAVRAAAACRGLGVAQLVRRALVMSLDLALRFATTLLMLASRNLSELREHALADGELGEVTVAGRPRDFTVRWTSAERSSHIQVATEEGCLEVRLRPALAAAVGFRILRQAAQIAP